MQELSSISVKTVLVVAVLLAAGVLRNTRSVEAADSGRCSLPAKTGPCRGAFPKFYYDSSSKSCKSFTYGGCNGNENRFDTEAECKAACGGVSRNTRSVEAADGGKCSLPPETGPCRGLFPKFYYNSSSKTCESFTYGGCDGNDNRFDTKAECMVACGGSENEDL